MEPTTNELNEKLKIEYPVQDDIWPSRRWKEDLSDYVDLSGSDDEEKINTADSIFY